MVYEKHLSKKSKIQKLKELNQLNKEFKFKKNY